MVSSSVEIGGGGVGSSGSVKTGVVDVSLDVVGVLVGLDVGLGTKKGLLVIVGLVVGMPVPQDDSGGGKIPDGMEVGAGMVLLVETVGKLETDVVGVAVVLEDWDGCGGNNVGSARVGCVKVGRTPERLLAVSSTDEVGADEAAESETGVEAVAVELSPTGTEDDGRGDDVVDFSDDGSIQSGKPGKVG